MKAKTHRRRGRSGWTECGRVVDNVVVVEDDARVTCQQCQKAIRRLPAVRAAIQEDR